MKKLHALVFAVGVAVFLLLFSRFTILTVFFWLLFGWMTELVRLFQSKHHVVSITVIALLFISSVSIHGYFTKRKTGTVGLFSRPVALIGLVFTFILSGHALTMILQEGSRLIHQRKAAFADEALLRKSETKLRNIGISAHEFMNDRGDQSYPPGGTVLESGQPGHGWTTQLLPYLGETALYERIEISTPWNDPHNAAVYREETPTIFRSSAKSRDRDFYRNRAGFGLTDYAANERAMPYAKPLPIKHFYSGTSNTLLAGEVNERLQPWGHPLNGRDPALGLNRTPLGFGSGRHRSDSVVFVFADGAAKAVSVDIDDHILELLADPQGDHYYLDDIHDF